jgi:hypothetical protein
MATFNKFRVVVRDGDEDTSKYMDGVRGYINRIQPQKNTSKIIAIECAIRLASSLQADGSVWADKLNLCFYQNCAGGLNYHESKVVELAYVLRVLGNSENEHRVTITAILNRQYGETRKPVRGVLVNGATASALARILLEYNPRKLWYQPLKMRRLAEMCVGRAPQPPSMGQITEKIKGLLSVRARQELSRYLERNKEGLAVSATTDDGASSSSTAPVEDTEEARILRFIDLRVGCFSSFPFFFFFFFF